MLYGCAYGNIAHRVRRAYRVDRGALLSWVRVVAVCVALGAASVAVGQEPTPTPTPTPGPTLYDAALQTNQFLIALMGMVFVLIMASQTKP